MPLITHRRTHPNTIDSCCELCILHPPLIDYRRAHDCCRRICLRRVTSKRPLNDRITVNNRIGNDIEKQIEKQEEGEEETDNREQGQPEQQQPEQQQQEVEQNNDDNKMDVDNDDDDDFVTPSRLNSTIIYPKAESVNTDNGQQDGEEKAAVEADGVGMDTEDSDVNEHITVAEPVEEAEKPAVNHPSVNHPSVIQQVTPLPGNYRRAVPVSQLLRNRCDVKTRKDGTITRYVPLVWQ